MWLLLLSISERVLENSERNSDISDLLSLKLEDVDLTSRSTLDLVDTKLYKIFAGIRNENDDNCTVLFVL